MKIKRSSRSFTLFVAILTCSLPLSAQVPEESQVNPGTSRDQAIASTLQAIFSEVESMEDIQVEVRHGVVHLRGETANWEIRQRAEEIAQQVEGVVYVQNQVKTSREIDTRIFPALTRTQEFLGELWSLVPLLLLAITIILLFWAAGSLLARWDRPYQRISDKVFIRIRLQQIVKTAVLLIGILLVLEILGLTTLVGTILGAAGIAGIILGFAFKDIIENYLAGILLSFRHPFSQNDHIRVGEFEGKVVRLTSRETVLMTLDGNHIRIPNSTVFNSVVINFTINPRRRFQFTAGVTPLVDLSRVRAVSIATLSSVEGVLASPPPTVLVEELGESTVNLRFFAWIDQRHSDFAKVRSEAIGRIKERFGIEGIDMPEPTYLIKMPEDGIGKVSDRATSLQTHTSENEPYVPDVSVDEHIDHQIEEDRSKSDEGNLLDETDSHQKR